MRKVQAWIVGFGMAVLLVFGSAPVAVAQAGGWAPPPTPVSSCSLEGVGWIVCPVLKAAAKAADFAFTFISQSFLQLEVTIFDPDNGVQKAWGVMLNIANVSFVIALLWVVYAHITGRGAGAYNVKRMLPRLIIGALLVQISFHISQLLIDVSNIMGSGISALLSGLAGQSAMPIATKVGDPATTALTSVTASILSNGQVSWVLLAPLTAIVLLAALICSVLIVIMIIRKTLTIALVLLSPLAFVAYLLPATEHLFSRWLKLLVQMLLLFPVVAILLGAGQIVSAAILAAGTGSGGYSVEHDDYSPPSDPSNTSSATLHLVAAGAAILPLAGTWFAFKAAMNGTDAAVARVKRGASRGSVRRQDDASKREKAAMELTNRTMMQKGFTRLQQLSNIQESRSGEGVLGNVFGSRRTRKKTQKSPEQAKFDQKVQDRLSEIRNEAEGQTPPVSPQVVYSRALQRYNDVQSGLGADEELSIDSQEHIDLKAAEALLLESLAKHSAGAGRNSTTEPSQLSPQEMSKNSNKEGAPTPPVAPRTPSGMASGVGGSAPADSGGAAEGAPVLVGVPQTIIVQGGSVDSSAGASGGAVGRAMGGGTRRDKPNNMEMQAKARAAKYVAQSQEQLLDAETEGLDAPLARRLQKDAPTPTLQKIEEMHASQHDDIPKAVPDISALPSTLRTAELTARTTRDKDEAVNGLRVHHDTTDTSSTGKKES